MTLENEQICKYLAQNTAHDDSLSRLMVTGMYIFFTSPRILGAHMSCNFDLQSHFFFLATQCCAR